MSRRQHSVFKLPVFILAFAVSVMSFLLVVSDQSRKFSVVITIFTKRRRSSVTNC